MARISSSSTPPCSQGDFGAVGPSKATVRFLQRHLGPSRRARAPPPSRGPQRAPGRPGAGVAAPRGAPGRLSLSGTRPQRVSSGRQRRRQPAARPRGRALPGHRTPGGGPPCGLRGRPERRARSGGLGGGCPTPGAMWNAVALRPLGRLRPGAAPPPPPGLQTPNHGFERKYKDLCHGKLPAHEPQNRGLERTRDVLCCRLVSNKAKDRRWAKTYPVLDGRILSVHRHVFEENVRNSEAVIKRYSELLETVSKGGGENAILRHTQRNKKLFVRDRLKLLLDDESFLELSPLAGLELPYGHVPAAGCLTGIGKICGVWCVFMANDATVKGGTIYPIGVKKQLRAQEIAMQNRLLSVYLVDSGGAFLPLQSELFPDKSHGGRVFYNEAIMSAMRIPQILSRLMDGSRFQEFKANYGTTLVTGFGHVLGHLVGIVANNGELTHDASLKGSHFVQLCSQRSVPILFLQNTAPHTAEPTSISQAEAQSHRLKAQASMMAAVACAAVPKITVVLGGCYGSESYVMCGRSFSPNFLFLWPNARVALVDSRHFSTVPRAGDNSCTGAESELKHLKEKLEEESSAFYSSARLWDDGVILPQDTRKVIAQCLEIVEQQKYQVVSRCQYPVIRM
ncbi:methylcrotonoyl-CoA carboxylase beta chain, mitochondrial-like isoform X2 [Athene noctua]|uniref:methylcrotonoyl-CoA carboxylase beta chain, mitochondrial-like isoform X2 n=1 Tax=Athene noctua TaxID=126797 RepID=UPI003EBAF9B4